MKLVLLSTILIGVMFSANAQSLPVNFKDCKYDNFFVSADIKPEWNDSERDLNSFLNEKLDNYQNFKKANGKIVLGILIYENGKTCCHSFMNMTNADLDPEIFKKIVNEMPDWKPGKQKEKPIIFLNQLVLNIEKGKIK